MGELFYRDVDPTNFLVPYVSTVLPAAAEKRKQHAARVAGLPELRVYGGGRSPAPLLRRGGAPTVDARARARARALSTK